jgi:hypothetical protein
MRTILSIIKLSLLAVCTGIVASCAGNRAMDSVIGSWQGQQVHEVIAAWGQPSENLAIEGKLLLIWNTSGGKPAGADGQAASFSASGGYCVRLLNADQKGRIIGGTWDGTDCPGWFSGWTR